MTSVLRLSSSVALALTPVAVSFTHLSAQSTAPAEQQQGEGRRVVVTASRTEEDPFETPRSIDVVDLEDLQRNQYRSVPQALRNLPSTFVQETSPGQGSPYLRGFTAYNNLMLIDGIRLNNSTFRAGPNQYWATIDPMSPVSYTHLRAHET